MIGNCELEQRNSIQTSSNINKKLISPSQFKKQNKQYSDSNQTEENLSSSSSSLEIKKQTIIINNNEDAEDNIFCNENNNELNFRLAQKNIKMPKFKLIPRVRQSEYVKNILKLDISKLGEVEKSQHIFTSVNNADCFTKKQKISLVNQSSQSLKLATTSNLQLKKSKFKERQTNIRLQKLLYSNTTNEENTQRFKQMCLIDNDSTKCPEILAQKIDSQTASATNESTNRIKWLQKSKIDSSKNLTANVIEKNDKKSNFLSLPQLFNEQRRTSSGISKFNIQITKYSIQDKDRVQSALVSGKRYQDFLKGDEKEKYEVYKENVVKIKQEEQLKRISTIKDNSSKHKL
ncbi:UNKNOWN [Stylonychia lemnae]|uniref:Uncharacterized protein n=1 Tax=Stylonychia lemnae TaxID=5949 RepID=A0A078AP21_STYLE|nr:UNKNOWN [Stylonychia lemnae]|eukprot:CDW82713.1 UNKNOWN [Stylonychia lemnae]